MNCSLFGFFLLFFLFLSLVGACDITNISFSLCNADPRCNNNLYIDANDGDLDVFSFLLLQITSRYDVLAQVQAELCNPNHTMAYEQLWVQYMAQYHHCHEVEKYFDGALKVCICRPNRECHYTHPRDLLFAFADWNIFLVFILFVVGCTALYSNYQFSTISKLLKVDILIGKNLGH